MSKVYKVTRTHNAIYLPNDLVNTLGKIILSTNQYNFGHIKASYPFYFRDKGPNYIRRFSIDHLDRPILQEFLWGQ